MANRGTVLSTWAICIHLFFLVWGVETARAERVLRLITDHWPPYESIAKRDAPGFSTEVIDQVMTRMGVRITLEEYPWKRAMQYVYAGRYDGIFTAFYSKDRAQYCHYPSEGLSQVSFVMVIRKSDRNRLSYDSFDDLDGKYVGLVRGSHYPEPFMAALKQRGMIQLGDNTRMNMAKLMKKRLDFIVAEYNNIWHIAREMGVTEEVLPLVDRPVKEDTIYLIFSKKTVSVSLVDEFSQTLKAFKMTESYKGLQRKYFGTH